MLGQLKHMYLIPTYFILHACVPPNKILLDIDSDEVEANVKHCCFFFVSFTSCSYEKLPAGGETSLHKGVGDIRNSLKEVCG